MFQIVEILKYVANHTGWADGEIHENSDIVTDLGCDGDDFGELIGKFSKDYNVDISTYRWYFHHTEEGSRNSIGGSIFRPPDKRVKRIPVTPGMLLEFARSGKWDILYPDNKVPQRRYDIIVNQLLVAVFLSILIYKCASK